jgi:hypothetical protein
MMRKVVISNGKRYLVTVPGAGDDFGVGPGAPPGVFWMLSNDGNWYQVALTGTSASAVLNINQTPLTWTSNDLNYQLVGDSGGNGKVYQVYLTGTASVVTLVVSSSAYPISDSNFKPYLNLLSTDGYFYHAYVTGSSTSLIIDQNSKIYIPTPFG